jgi:hypothetical protein
MSSRKALPAFATFTGTDRNSPRDFQIGLRFTF